MALIFPAIRRVSDLWDEIDLGHCDGPYGVYGVVRTKVTLTGRVNEEK